MNSLRTPSWVKTHLQVPLLQHFFEESALKNIELACETQYALGLSYAFQNEHDKAIVVYKNCAKIQKKFGFKRALRQTYEKLGSSLDYRGRYAEGIRVLTKSIALCREIGLKKELCSTLNSLSFLYLQEEQIGSAIDYSYESFEIAIELDLKQELSRAFTFLGAANLANRDFDTSLEFCSRALEIAEKGDFKEEIAMALQFKAMAHSIQGEHQRALCFLYDSLNIIQELGNEKLVMLILSNLGHVLRGIGWVDEAEMRSLEAIKIARELNLKKELAIFLNNLGTLCMNRQQFLEAEVYYTEASLIGQVKEYMHISCYTYCNLALLFCNQNKCDKALESCRKGLELMKAIDRVAVDASFLPMFADVLVTFEIYNEGLEHYQKLIGIASSLKDNKLMAESLLGVSRCFLGKKQYEEAVVYLYECKNVFEVFEDRPKLAYSLHLLGVAHKNLKHFEESVEAYKTCLGIRQELEDFSGIQRTTKRLIEVLKTMGKTTEALEYEKV